MEPAPWCSRVVRGAAGQLREHRRCVCRKHRFGRPAGIPYKCLWEDRIFNYFVGHLELGLDVAPVLDHFTPILGAEKVHLCREAAEKAHALQACTP